MNYSLVKAILQPWFLISCFLVLVHQVAERVFDLHHWFLDSYFDPLFLMPILLHLVLWERRLLFIRGTQYVFSKTTLFLYFVISITLFELLFPVLEPRFKTDIFDVLIYAIGTVLFYFYGNKAYIEPKK